MAKRMKHSRSSTTAPKSWNGEELHDDDDDTGGIVWLIYVFSTALAVQIYLQMDRVDLARKEVAHAKSWAEDALLLQLMEAWVGLRVVSTISCHHGGTTSFLIWGSLGR